MRKSKYITAFALCILPVKFFLAQIIISGTITDKSNTFVKGVSVTITEVKSNQILAYSITDSKGHYQISYKKNAFKKLQINIRALSYRLEQKIIENKSQKINFSLEPSAIKIKEVVITPPIVRKKDTISYNVESFADKKDRNIEEVIAKMPGVEVSDNGQILYQGKAINKFMIEGLDALGGRYSLATKNLPHDKVAKVQILENYQPVKVLDSLVFSDQAAINIKLKNKVTFTGSTEAGAGASPFLWELNSTPMLFNPKKQIITSYQTNNTGYDASSQLRILTVEQLRSLDDFFNEDSKQQMLGIQALSSPGLPREKWLDNNIHLLTSNYLTPLKKDYTLRIHASYLNDYQQKEGYTKTVFFTPRDTISVLEKKYNQLYFNSLKMDMTIEKNTDKNYFITRLHFQNSWDSQRGSIKRTPDKNITENLRNPYVKLSNKLTTVFPVNKKLITLNSLISFSKSPQELWVKPPSQFKRLPKPENYQDATQEAETQTIYADHSIHFTKALGNFTLYPKIGFLIEKQKLETALSTKPNSELSAHFSNNLNRLRTETYFKNEIQYKKNAWRAELSVPLSYYTLNLKDLPLHKQNDFNQFIFAPKLSLTRDLGTFFKVSTYYELSNGFNADNIRYGYVLQSYRKLERTDTPPSKTFNGKFSSRIYYRNPIRSLFAYLSYAYSTSKNNLLYTQDIQPDGSIEQQALEKDNRQNSHALSGSISKFFSDLKTHISVNSSLSMGASKQVISSEITDIKNRNLSMGLKTDTNLTDWLGLNYQVQWSLSRSKIQSRKNQNIITQSHKWSLNIYPSDRQYIGVKSVYFQNDLFSEKTNYFFMDMVYRYTLKKKKIDFELQCRNIFNTRNYKNVTVEGFSYDETGFTLRPMQILFKVRFSL